VKNKKPTAGIILAAGMSTRFGRPKQMLLLQGKPLLEWVIDACLASRLDRIILVLGHEAQKILNMLKHKISPTRVQTVVNSRYRAGMSQSLQSGLSAISRTSPSAMFLLGDQPMIDAEMINLLLDNFWASQKNICVPVYQSNRGNPVVFSDDFYEALFQTKNDIGARHIIQKNPDQVLRIEIENPLCFFDIDTEEDLRTLHAYLA
jgi:molybdenum cofactor cytidylyltransferase